MHASFCRAFFCNQANCATHQCQHSLVLYNDFGPVLICNFHNFHIILSCIIITHSSLKSVVYKLQVAHYFILHFFTLAYVSVVTLKCIYIHFNRDQHYLTESLLFYKYLQKIYNKVRTASN